MPKCYSLVKYGMHASDFVHLQNPPQFDDLLVVEAHIIEMHTQKRSRLSQSLLRNDTNLLEAHAHPAQIEVQKSFGVVQILAKYMFKGF